MRIAYHNSSSAADRIFKDVIGSDQITGLPYLHYNHWLVSPTNGIFDVTTGDLIKNFYFYAGAVPGWYCVFTAAPTITSASGSAVVVNSVSGIAAGDIIALCVDSDPYDADYYTASKYHVTTVSSVDYGTLTINLTAAIPSGESYTASSACRVARFKAAPAIAA